MKAIQVLLLALLLLSVTAQPRKQLAGLPDTFDDHRIVSVPTFSRSAFLKVHLSAESLGKMIGQVSVAVDKLHMFEMVVASPFVEHLKFVLTSPAGKVVDMESAKVLTDMPIGSMANGVPVNYYSLDTDETGFYMLDIFTETDNEDVLYEIQNNNVADVVVITFTGDNIEIEGMLLDTVVSTGRQVGLKARLLIEGLSATESSEDIIVTDSHISVTTPNGDEVDVRMNDEGYGADLEANDDFYSGHMQLTSEGNYQFEAFLSGWVKSNGKMVPFTKSIDILIPAAKPVDFVGTASFKVKDSQRASINLDMVTDDLLEGTLGNYRAYTEVYGESTGESVPVAWLSSIVNVIDGVVSLELNMNWLKIAKAKGPLTLKNTYLLDLQNEMVVSKFDQDIHVSDSDLTKIVEYRNILRSEKTEITSEMRFGVNPLRSARLNASAPSLMMLHGYCADTNPWESNSKDIFENAAYFLKSGSNLPIDTYAQLVHEFAESIGTQRYSVIGHSQGGMVGLHLLNGYWSGIDQSTGGPKVQSVGTPWNGCTGAGNVADLGAIFGVTCGKNNDLTTQGASNWLATIDSDSRSQVQFYTTTYAKGKLFGDYCNMAVNLLLQWPNDGTSEDKYNKLNGGVNMGNTEKQCHTTDMKYTAQYQDKNRNKKMNDAAAR